jgi:hypothetical protein
LALEDSSGDINKDHRLLGLVDVDGGIEATVDLEGGFFYLAGIGYIEVFG